MPLIIREGCGDEGIDYHQRESRTDNPCSHTKDICIIMLSCGFSGEYIMTERSAYAGLFIGGHGHTYAGAADQDAKLRMLFPDLFTNLL